MSGIIHGKLLIHPSVGVGIFGLVISSPRNNPKGQPTGQYRVMRGGWGYDYQDGVRVSNRNYFPGGRCINLGFRCAQ